MNVFLVVYDRKAYSLSEKLFAAVTEYIDDNYIDQHHIKSNQARRQQEVYYSEAPKTPRSLEDLMDELEETFF